MTEADAPEKHPGGRPSDYTPEKATEICVRIADGQSVREIARGEDMPSMATIFRWLSVHPEFQEQYARAKEAQALYLAEEILDVADDGTNDWMERKNDDGETIGWNVNGEAIQRSKLRVDTRKWLLSKLLPKKYGDRVAMEHSGPDGNPIETKDVSDVEIARRAALMLERAARLVCEGENEK